MRICLVFAALVAGCAAPPPASPPCVAARSLVKERAVGLEAPGLHTVRSLIRAIRSRDLFVKVDRRIMARWRREPSARATWLERLQRTSARVEELRAIAGERLHTGDEAADLSRAERILRLMRHRDAAWRGLYSKVEPRDYPFVLTGRKALELGVLDGCTSASRTFCLLARAAGLEVRLVGASDLEGLRHIWRPGEERVDGGVNGHKMALVRLEGTWHLVNTNYHAPARNPPYEILDSLKGEPVEPGTLPGKVLRLPSMQVADGRRSPALVVTGVAGPDAEDLGEFTREANLNLAVSGDAACPTCRNPALVDVLARK